MWLEDTVILGYDVTSLANRFPKLRDDVQEEFLDISTVEDETITVSRKAGNRLSTDAASNCRR